MTGSSAHRQIDMPLSCSRFVERIVDIDRKRKAQAPVLVGKRALAETQQTVRLEPSPTVGEVEIHQWLVEFVFFVDVFDQVGLVDDVNEVP
jgi:hypothetical protein